MKQAERPGLHRWSRHEYGQLIDHGLLDEDDPVELLVADYWIRNLARCEAEPPLPHDQPD